MNSLPNSTNLNTRGEYWEIAGKPTILGFEPKCCPSSLIYKNGTKWTTHLLEVLPTNLEELVKLIPLPIPIGDVVVIDAKSS